MNHSAIVMLLLGIALVETNAGIFGPNELEGGLNVAFPDDKSKLLRRPILQSWSKDNVRSRNDINLLRDSVFDEKYKPWGAATFPDESRNPASVVVDRVDEELFTPNSEVHTYDERSHEETRLKMINNKLKHLT